LRVDASRGLPMSRNGPGRRPFTVQVKPGLHAICAGANEGRPTGPVATFRSIQVQVHHSQVAIVGGAAGPVDVKHWYLQQPVFSAGRCQSISGRRVSAPAQIGDVVYVGPAGPRDTLHDAVQHRERSPFGVTTMPAALGAPLPLPQAGRTPPTRPRSKG